MVLHALGVDLRRLPRDAQRQEERQDDAVALLRRARELDAGLCQGDRTLRLGVHVSVPLQAPDHPAHRDVADAEAA